MKYAQIFQYKLSLSAEDYRSKWQEPYAKDIANVPGLIRKTWMADFYACVFASVYI